MPGKAKAQDFKVGPYSKDRTLARLDKRTRPGRVFRSAVADLTQHLGGAPTAAETLIIQSAALKSVRLFLLSEKLLSGGDIADDHSVLAWLNSLRLDLTTLGLERRARDITPSLKDILAEHAGAPLPRRKEAAA